MQDAMNAQAASNLNKKGSIINNQLLLGSLPIMPRKSVVKAFSPIFSIPY
jgi:hypothetical protein